MLGHVASGCRCFGRIGIVATLIVVQSVPSVADTEYPADTANAAAILRIFDALAGGPDEADVSLPRVVAAIAAPDFVRHDLTGLIAGIEGPAGATNFLEDLRAGFPDLELRIEDVVAADDKVVVRFVAEGTHNGPFLGHDGTGRRIAINNINIYRFENGKVVETWQLYDSRGLLAQLGLNPP